LAHLENQTCNDFEVVVVDDGSTDSTPRLMEPYLKKTRLAVRYVRQDNGGPAKARNLGISMLQSPVCVLIGDDIFASSTLVERHMNWHGKNPELNAVAVGWTQWNATGQTITPFMRWLGESPEQFAYKDLLAGAEPDWHNFYTSNLSVKTELLRSFPFNECFPYAAMEDSEVGYRIQKECGLKIKFLPEAVAYHLHPTTFRQFCERMVRVGCSWGLFHDLWPEQRLPPPTKMLSRALDSALRAIARSPLLTGLLVWSADIASLAVCPNRLMKAAYLCKFQVGYESRRDSDGKLAQHRS